MAITRLNPEVRRQTAEYAHVTIVEANRLAVLAGQCPLNRDGEIVGRGDLAVQVDQVVANTQEVLAAIGAGPADVIRSVIYVVSDHPDVLSAVWDQLSGSAIASAFTASTLLGTSRRPRLPGTSSSRST